MPLNEDDLSLLIDIEEFINHGGLLSCGQLRVSRSNKKITNYASV
jgi:hypothetical protein